MKETKVYHITGILRNGRRFPRITTTNYMQAMFINLWNGTVWEVIDGHRKMIKRVYN